MTRLVLLLCALLLLWRLLTGCATPRDQIVLLGAEPGEELTITTRQGTAALTVPLSSAEVQPGGQVTHARLTQEVLRTRYGAVLGLLPAPGRLWTLRFDTGQTTLEPESQAEVPALLEAITDKAAVEVLIEGHSDQAGDEASNDALSLARAEAVRALLVAQGMQAPFVRVVGRGSRSPLVDVPGQAEAQNRRVEVVVR